MVKLEAGKQYLTRDGRKATVVWRSDIGCYFFVDVEGLHTRQVYRPNGKWGVDSSFDDLQRAEDIVSEYSNTTDNPKKQYGDKKPALGQLPLAGMVAQSLAHMDGDYKYGFRNWRDSPVEAMTYVHAAMRHLMLWAEGEENARDTDIPNLGGVMACCAILIDAQVNDALIDNRSKSDGACDALHDAEKNVEYLKKLALDRERDKP